VIGPYGREAFLRTRDSRRENMNVKKEEEIEDFKGTEDHAHDQNPREGSNSSREGSDRKTI